MKQTVKKAMRGDTDAFAELIETYKVDLYKTAYAILDNNEDAADAIQNTILICFEKIQDLREARYFKTWMTRILINECRRMIREQQKRCLLEDFHEFPCTQKSEDVSIEQVEFKELLQYLDEKYRVVVVLYYAQNYRVREIAELLEISENTVKTRLKRAREQLAKEYEVVEFPERDITPHIVETEETMPYRRECF